MKHTNTSAKASAKKATTTTTTTRAAAVSLYSAKAEYLTKGQKIKAIAADKKATRATLSDFALSLESAYKQLTAVGSSCRNVANAVKGQCKTAVAVVAAYYPYQTADGRLCVKRKGGEFAEKRLKGTAAAYSAVKAAVCNYVDYKGGRRAEAVTIVEIAAE